MGLNIDLVLGLHTSLYLRCLLTLKILCLPRPLRADLIVKLHAFHDFINDVTLEFPSTPLPPPVHVLVSVADVQGHPSCSSYSVIRTHLHIVGTSHRFSMTTLQ